MFRPNRTLDKTIVTAMEQGCHSMMERCIMRVRLAFLPRAKRAELEKGLTELVTSALPAASIVGGIFVGDWMDIIQYIIENLDVILEFILAIITIFLSQ